MVDTFTYPPYVVTMPNQTSPQWFSVQDAADWLGVHENTIYRWVAAGHLPERRVGVLGRLRFTQADLEGVVNGEASRPDRG